MDRLARTVIDCRYIEVVDSSQQLNRQQQQLMARLVPMLQLNIGAQSPKLGHARKAFHFLSKKKNRKKSASAQTRKTNAHPINAFQDLIPRAFASQGWQNVAVGHVGFDFASAPSVQILHNGANHWLTSASTSVGVLVADSLLAEPNLVICQQLLNLYCKTRLACCHIH